MSKNLTVINMYGCWIVTGGLIAGSILDYTDITLFKAFLPVIIYNSFLVARTIVLGLLR